MKLTSLLMLSALATPLQLVACTPQQIDEVAPAEGADQARGEGPTEKLPTTQLLDVGGFRMHLHCLGEGSPVVVLDAGISETYRTWEAVLEEVGQDARVCGYDRAGYGESEVGPFPRTARRAASELAALLAAAGGNAGITSPYILVGHSLGALNSLVFAVERPELVAGLVLVDPPPLAFLAGERFPELGEMFQRQTEEFSKTAAESRDRGEEAQAVFYEAMASEQEMMLTESLEACAEIDDLGDLPLIVIGSARPNFAFGDDAEEFQAFWIESNEEVAALSSSGKFILAEQAGHHVHLDEPAVVIGAIREMIAALNRARAIGGHPARIR